MKKIIVSLLLLLAGAGALALEIPYLSGHINDTADMLGSGAVSELEQLLTQYEETSGNQIVLLTIATLDGEALEDYSLRVADTWKLGQKDVDNGWLLSIVRDDRQLRCELAFGLELAPRD